MEDAIQQASILKQEWMSKNQNDPRVDELQRIVEHLTSVLKKDPQSMKSEGASTIENYMDDAVMPQGANTIKREFDMILNWRKQGSTKKANAGAFVTDRDEKGEPKTPEKMEVPRLAAKKKKEAIPEPPIADPMANPATDVSDPAAEPVAMDPVSAPPTTPQDAGGEVNPIDYIPTDALIKIIGDMPKEEDFAQSKPKQDALIKLTEILKSRPILPPEQPEGQGQAPVAPAPALANTPIAASNKRADLGDHAMGGNGNIGDVGHGSGSHSTNKMDSDSSTNNGNPIPGQAPIELGGLNLAASEKVADERYQLHNLKVDESGVEPSHAPGSLPDMDEQEQHMHPENPEDDRFFDHGLQEEGIAPTGMLPGDLGENDPVMEAGAFTDKESVSPEGWGGTVEHMKDHKDIDNPFALAYYMKNKGDSPHYKESDDETDTVPRRMAALAHWKKRQASMYRELAAKYASGAAGGAWSFDIGEKGKVVEDGGRTPEVGEAHSMLDEAPAKLERPATTAPIKLAADMTVSKAVKQSETIGNELKKKYLEAKSLTLVNDSRPVREAVESIFRAAAMFENATKTLSKQQQAEESEAEAAMIKEKNKKSSMLGGLELAAAV